MLGQRILTAIVLLAALAAAAAAGMVWLEILMALAAACAGWEWLRLTLPARGQGAGAIAAGVCLFALMLAFLGFKEFAILSLTPWTMTFAQTRDFFAYTWVLITAVCAVWLFAATLAVARGRAGAPPASLGWSLFGALAVFTAWLTLDLMLTGAGAWCLASLLGLVWAADICAYFGGRALGRHKLAPRVSPGKTIEGAVAGVLGAVAWTLASSYWPGSFGRLLIDGWTVWGAAAAAAFLALVSIVGDLFESLLKRRAGRKDSSALLPGHGGVYDRVDAILPVAPMAYFMTLAAGP
jgi:phosphatidate cytidylyltransferase